MAAITSVTTRGLTPALGKKMLFLLTPSTADSGDTIDVTDSGVTGGETIATINYVTAWDKTDGDIVTATESSGVITLDTGGGTTNHVYGVIVIGDA